MQELPAKMFRQGQRYSLEYLYLNNNQLKALPANFFHSRYKLKKLDLQHNRIISIDIIQHVFRSGHNITNRADAELLLGNNQIKKIDSITVFDLKFSRFVLLDLSDNLIDAIDPKLSSIETFQLGELKVKKRYF